MSDAAYVGGSSDVEIRDAPQQFGADASNWLTNLNILWTERALLKRWAGMSFLISLIISLLVPKVFVSRARIMPPEMSQSNSAVLSLLAGRALGNDSLGGLAAALMGGRSSGALFVDLLASDSVTDPMIDRFELQHVYHKRYKVDAAKALARRTTIAQDKKSGVITVSVRDRDPQRARDLAQAYLDGLNSLLIRTSTSPAHQERAFIERRLSEVRHDLSSAQEAMSEFSATHTTIDLKEQTIATVESQTKIEGQLIAAQSELQSVQQIYGDKNIRVRTSEARIATLKKELAQLGGSSAPLPASDTTPDLNSSYLPLRQVPRLAIPYANLYRELHIQETVYDLLSQQFEVARIQEAKDIPIVNVIDAPRVPEKKSFPPRALLTIGLTAILLSGGCLYLLVRHHWALIDPADPKRRLGEEVFRAFDAFWPLRRNRTVP